MSEALHRAIRDALRDAQAYAAHDVTVSTFLDATRPLHADDTILYRAVYTIFRALPARLLRGSTLNISTYDTEEGVELLWEGREPAQQEAPSESSLRVVYGRGPHGDLLEIALRALEEFCDVRAGYVQTSRERVDSSTSFDRPAYIIRRVRAHIPARQPPAALGVGSGHPAVDANAPATMPGEEDAREGSTFRARLPPARRALA